MGKKRVIRFFPCKGQGLFSDLSQLTCGKIALKIIKEVGIFSHQGGRDSRVFLHSFSIKTERLREILNTTKLCIQYGGDGIRTRRVNSYSMSKRIV